MTRSNCTCRGNGNSPISSRSRVPSFANAKAPLRSVNAPVNAPRSCPKNSLPDNSGTMLAQSRTTRSRLFGRESRRWMSRATTSFPVPLSPSKEVHLILAEGAHNQFGDLTWTARAEMLTIQWMLARPEMREFLRGRYMVPYQEGWMGAVDSMKKLQGWTDTTITHFYELPVTGERILLSFRSAASSAIQNT